jgi:hypothetical protein
MPAKTYIQLTFLAAALLLGVCKPVEAVLPKNPDL